VIPMAQRERTESELYALDCDTYLSERADEFRKLYLDLCKLVKARFPALDVAESSDVSDSDVQELGEFICDSVLRVPPNSDDEAFIEPDGDAGDDEAEFVPDAEDDDGEDEYDEEDEEGEDEDDE